MFPLNHLCKARLKDIRDNGDISDALFGAPHHSSVKTILKAYGYIEDYYTDTPFPKRKWRLTEEGEDYAATL